MAGVVTALFSACSLLAAACRSIWPVWQLQGRYARARGAPRLPRASSWPRWRAFRCRRRRDRIAGASPALLLLRPTYAARGIRCDVSVRGRRCIWLRELRRPRHLISLSANLKLVGDHRVGQQVLYWSFAVVLSQASQAFAARYRGREQVGRRGGLAARALRAWLPPAASLDRRRDHLCDLHGPDPALPGYSGAARDAMTMTMLVSGMAPAHHGRHETHFRPGFAPHARGRQLAEQRMCGRMVSLAPDAPGPPSACSAPRCWERRGAPRLRDRCAGATVHARRDSPPDSSSSRSRWRSVEA